EGAAKLSGGTIVISYLAGEEWSETSYSTKNSCPCCDLEFPELTPKSFSFNSPYGACENCDGFGFLECFIEEKITDTRRSIETGAITIWEHLAKKTKEKKLAQLAAIGRHVGLVADMPLSELSTSQLALFFDSMAPKMPGLKAVLEKEYATVIDDVYWNHLDSFRDNSTCRSCEGSRLNSISSSVRLGGKTIAQIVAMNLSTAASFFESYRSQCTHVEIKESILDPILHRLNFLNGIGLHYLSLGRSTDSLSGGELQRTRLAKSIGGGLTGTCYILDEPSAGLHASDTYRLIESMLELRNRGNSLVVIEHDISVMQAGDKLIEIGPEAGPDGGHLIASGSPNEILKNPASLLGGHLNVGFTYEFGQNPPNFKRKIVLEGAQGFNLKNVSVEIPLRAFVCVTGVSGSGKSTLLGKTLIPALK
ncbi:MAG: ABC-ATPase UvrA, partial [Planctomycetota bacterium]